MDPTTAPPWWLTRPREIRDFLESLDGVEVEEIGTTGGGRPIVAAGWGGREEPRGRTSASLASAIAGGDPAAFFGEGEREKQTILFVGATHGTEWDGTVAALHYLNILATGRDLLGREWPEVARRGRAHRFFLIPILNVDGRERALHHVHWIGCDPDYFMDVSQGVWASGEGLRWPTAKRHCPIPTDEVRVLGTYYNDNGVNLVYDVPFGGDGQPETTALLRACRREVPDLVVLSHSNHGSLVEPPASFIPDTWKQKVVQMGAAVGVRCHREGFAKSGIPSRVRSYAGDIFCQTDAVYHACGAVPLLIEFPCGWAGVPATHREILDIGLAVLDELALFGARYGFRPEVSSEWSPSD
ncbi:MAG: M14 family zinc carboxypeptidase [Candidatus Brocadiia bacterium]